ncbi:hypothetical protein ACQ4WX_49435 [Streptomyces lasalocidi]
MPDDKDPGDIVFMRLLRCADRQIQASRLQLARALADLAADVRTGALPMPRTHRGDLRSGAGGASPLRHANLTGIPCLASASAESVRVRGA